MQGLVLEGGGAKGSYHLGVYRAFMEEGWRFSGVVGTSIGALNGAMIAQGDWETAYRMWEAVEYSQLFDITPEESENILVKGTTKEQLKFFAARLAGVINHAGVDTGKIRAFLEGALNEEKLRASGMEYGLVTVNLSSLKPAELFLKDIPEGELIDYVMASASFPGLKALRINRKLFLDGGLYDNCPINMLGDKGYGRAVVVHTYGIGRRQRLRAEGMEVLELWPSDSTGATFQFEQGQMRYNLDMGYYDGLRLLRRLSGTRYCIQPPREQDILKRLLGISPARLEAACDCLGISPSRSLRVLFEHWLPALAAQLELPFDAPYADIVVAALEQKAWRARLPRFCIYEFNDFLKKVQKAKPKEIPAKGWKERLQGVLDSGALRCADLLCDSL